MLKRKVESNPKKVNKIFKRPKVILPFLAHNSTALKMDSRIAKSPIQKPAPVAPPIQKVAPAPDPIQKLAPAPDPTRKLDSIGTAIPVVMNTPVENAWYRYIAQKPKLWALMCFADDYVRQVACIEFGVSPGDPGFETHIPVSVWKSLWAPGLGIKKNIQDLFPTNAQWTAALSAAGILTPFNPIDPFNPFNTF